MNASVFRIDWEDLQLNLPDLTSPGSFYIANVGGATSSGVELELNARLHPSVDVFGGLGYTKATFSDGSVSSGVPVGGNLIPNTPEYSATLGAQVSHAVRPGISVYGRGEAVFYGAFEYDDMNTARQDAYSLANFRAGARGRYLFAEVWIRNAFEHGVHPGRVCLRSAGPVRLHRRNGQAAHLRRQRRRRLLARPSCTNPCS